MSSTPALVPSSLSSRLRSPFRLRSPQISPTAPSYSPYCATRSLSRFCQSSKLLLQFSTFSSIFFSSFSASAVSNLALMASSTEEICACVAFSAVCCWRCCIVSARCLTRSSKLHWLVMVCSSFCVQSRSKDEAQVFVAKSLRRVWRELTCSRVTRESSCVWFATVDWRSVRRRVAGGRIGFVAGFECDGGVTTNVIVRLYGREGSIWSETRGSGAGKFASAREHDVDTHTVVLAHALISLSKRNMSEALDRSALNTLSIVETKLLSRTANGAVFTALCYIMGMIDVVSYIVADHINHTQNFWV